jgi:serine/threonine-protein phosphatase 2B catalytic subunit
VANERLPDMQPIPTAYPSLPAPSMRTPLTAHFQRQWNSGNSTPTSGEDGDGSTPPADENRAPPGAWPGTMEELIRRTLDDDEGGGVVERLAERIARGRKPTGKPHPLKRYETA